MPAQVEYSRSGSISFSIVTPSYKQFPWLKLCIRSVADQTVAIDSKRTTLFSVEHLVQDAGTPGIETLVSGLNVKNKDEDSIPRYRFYLNVESDSGMYDAINKGLAKASGDICAWLNCDEQYLPGTLAKVAEIFEKDPELDVLLGDAVLVGPDMHPIGYRRIMVPSQWHTRLDHLFSLSCAMFFRKRALPDPPLDPGKKVISDAVLMDFFLQQGFKIKACGLPLSIFVMTGQNLSWTKAARQEMTAWHNDLGWPPLAWRPIVTFFHRLRRLLNGSYNTRYSEISVFTPESSDKRQCFAKKIGGFWPKPDGYEP